MRDEKIGQTLWSYSCHIVYRSLCSLLNPHPFPPDPTGFTSPYYDSIANLIRSCTFYRIGLGRLLGQLTIRYLLLLRKLSLGHLCALVRSKSSTGTRGLISWSRENYFALLAKIATYYPKQNRTTLFIQHFHIQYTNNIPQTQCMHAHTCRNYKSIVSYKFK